MNILLLLLSWFIVSFGQPAWSSFLGEVSSAIGLGIFWSTILLICNAQKRFWICLGWFAAVQAVQLSWLLTHPYNYIYFIYFFLILWISLQFAFIGVWITNERMKSWSFILALTGLYTIFEWGRLYLLSGFSFNPLGIAYTSSLYGLQVASLIGIYGLSFLLLLTSFAFARAVMLYPQSLSSWTTYAVLILFPYLFGAWHLEQHRYRIDEFKSNPSNVLKIALVQTAFPVEETMPFQSLQEAVKYVQWEWEEVFRLLAPQLDKGVELVVLPEYLVPYGTYMAVFPFQELEKSLLKIIGERVKTAFPPLQEPLALEVENEKQEKVWHVSNAFLAQTLANLFEADLVVGLQDDQWVVDREVQSFSAAFYFWPKGEMGLRYEKQVLVPMAEYIPGEFFKEMARAYGISGSFTPGPGAKVFPGCKIPFGLSICYEETYGDLMRENRLKGAEILINLTSDIWYPNSRLPKQHFDHARLRSVEGGLPLVRSCNTGITCAIDSLGQVIDTFSEEDEWERKILVSEVPLYSYKTLYMYTGDRPVIWGSIGFFSFFLISRRKSFLRFRFQ